MYEMYAIYFSYPLKLKYVIASYFITYKKENSLKALKDKRILKRIEFYLCNHRILHRIHQILSRPPTSPFANLLPRNVTKRIDIENASHCINIAALGGFWDQFLRHFAKYGRLKEHKSNKKITTK